jgi:hypothetical protein
MNVDTFVTDVRDLLAELERAGHLGAPTEIRLALVPHPSVLATRWTWRASCGSRRAEGESSEKAANGLVALLRREVEILCRAPSGAAASAILRQLQGSR